MFGIDSTEFLLIAVVALVVIGPKDLPRVMRLVGGWVGRGKAMTRHLRSGFDTMMREAELEEMQKQWAKQNAEIMAATSMAPVAPHAWDVPHDAPDAAPVFDHPGALPVETSVERPAGSAGDYAPVMTGPQPASHALAEPPASGPAIAEPAPAEPALPTAQP